MFLMQNGRLPGEFLPPVQDLPGNTVSITTLTTQYTKVNIVQAFNQ